MSTASSWCAPVKSNAFRAVAMLALCHGAHASDHPSVVLSNGVVSLRSYLPGGTNSHYRGVRFVRCSMTDETIAGQTRFYGRLFSGAHKPDDNAHACGMAEEFDIDAPPGFADAEPGGNFLKIGVGVLSKPDGRPYDFGRKYPVVDPGVWSMETHGSTGVVYRHSVKTPDGKLGATYTHALLLGEGSGSLVIRRSLKNIGTDVLATRHYMHHFISVDGAPVTGAYSIHYPFQPAAATAVPDEMEINGATVGFTKTPRGWIRLGLGNFEGAENRFTVRHDEIRAGIETHTDRPVVDACVFATPGVVCPEMFSDIRVAPGETRTWTTAVKFLLP